MPAPKKGARFGGSPAHQKLIMSNLATSLFEHGRITTTEAKARHLRPIAEKLITKAKKGDLHNRREVLKTIRNKSVVHVLFTEIAVTFSERPGGYTRITKLGPRKGDNAPMAVIELVTEAYNPKPSNSKAKAAPAAASPVEETSAEVIEPDAVTEAEPTEGLETEAPAELVDAEVTDETTEVEAPSYAGSHAPLEDVNEAPEGFPIKGNADSMLFHEPDGQWFEATVAEVWFDTAESAEAAGFKKAGS